MAKKNTSAKTKPGQRYRVNKPKSRHVPDLKIMKHKGMYTHTGYEASGYRSAAVAAVDNYSEATGLGSEVHDATDRTRLIAQSRKFVRDNGIYKGIKQGYDCFNNISQNINS